MAIFLVRSHTFYVSNTFLLIPAF